MVPVRPSVANATHRAVLLDQPVHPRPHHQAEVGVLTRLGGDELEEARLGEHQHVRVAGLQAGEVGEDGGAAGGLNGEPGNLGVAQPEQPVRQAQLLHHLHDRGIDGVAPKLAVEVLACLEQRHRDAPARQEEPQHDPRRPAADDATVVGPPAGSETRLASVLLRWGGSTAGGGLGFLRGGTGSRI